MVSLATVERFTVRADGKTGERFILTAKPTKTFGELAAGAKGVYAGPRDLSTREGFGG